MAAMTICFAERTLIIIQLLIMIFISAAAAQQDPPDCQRWCGDVEIPYPFGTTESCALGDKFLINCSNEEPILGENLVVTNISVENHEVSIMSYIARLCYESKVDQNRPSLKVPMFTISSSKNKFTVVGCDSYGYLYGNYETQSNYSMGCFTRCVNLDRVSANDSCSGIGCCHMDIPPGLKNIYVEPYSFKNYTKVAMDLNPCTYAFVVEKGKFNFSQDYLLNGFTPEKLPLVLEWTIDNDTCAAARHQATPAFCRCGGNTTTHYFNDSSGSYYCNCKQGFDGNPYTPLGCQDVDECLASNNCTEKGQECINQPGTYTCKSTKDEQLVTKVIFGVAIGIIAFLVSSSWLYLVFKRRKVMKLKEKFFRQNGGFILKQKLSREEDYSNETVKIFTEEELKKATLNYDASTIIGRGGFGTVYKGFLQDNKIVAIKKSKIVDQSQTEQFINEVIVLSRINHRNVVKLLGCCLETEVPLLVYEFVPNGTLFEHIHDKNKASNLPWEVRLGIAAETAGALSYLHSAASTPIIHRDVKSSNILLDNYTAKVSDFGASRLVPVDQIEVATMVQGTLGYLDPEYLHTNYLTEKSDVYSFGVVLLELLTGRKALSFDMPEEEENLAKYFLYSLREGRLFEVIESNINKEENKEQLKEVAELAKRCLNLNGDDRPSMKEVAMQLEGLRKTQKHPWVNAGVNIEETENLLAETSNGNDATAAYDSISNHVALDFSGR
nr:putative wall-associated receptor kinase-like 16 [Ziziphus jujuba var. spinosa]